MLGGWLFRTTRLVAAHARRAEQRRKSREATACTMSRDAASPDTDEILWEQLAPHLDQAVAALSEADRSAILLRFYEKMPLRQVGEKLGVSEEAAKKRVSRAVEKLREFLDRRGRQARAASRSRLFWPRKPCRRLRRRWPGRSSRPPLAAASASAATMLPRLARETLRAWHWAKLKLAVGLGAASLALIFVAAKATSLIPRKAAPPPVSAVGAPGAADATGGGESPIRAARQKHNPGAAKDRRASPAQWWIPRAIRSRAPRSGAGSARSLYAQDTTDDSGQFALDKIALPPFVTVTADGYAADQQAFDPTNVPGPLQFRLSPVPPLQVRLVDESGQGVAGVWMFLDQWWGSHSTLGQYVEKRTDADGRLQWLSPPKGELELSFGKPGYRYSRTNKFAAEGEWHTIVLHPAASVTGSVTDAETGVPVPGFKLTQGHSQPWSPTDPVPLWDMKGHACSNGLYTAVIDEEQIPFLRIEAEGYETGRNRSPVGPRAGSGPRFPVAAQQPHELHPRRRAAARWQSRSGDRSGPLHG